MIRRFVPKGTPVFFIKKLEVTICDIQFDESGFEITDCDLKLNWYMRNESIVPVDRIESKIYFIRGKKVMLDRDLAKLYGVSTKVLNQNTKRNVPRFPEDFMFQLSKSEFESWRSQFVTSNRERMGLRYAPLVFTEQGVAMLSSVLKSDRAIAVNIQIIRTFTKLREMLIESDYLRRKVEAMEKQYDENFKVVFDAIRGLIGSGEEPKEEIGFKS